RTSQREQIRLASLVEPPFSGKNASGSVCEHSARSCHSGAYPSRSTPTVRPSILPPSHAPAAAGATPHAEGVFVTFGGVRAASWNNPSEITRVLCVRRQAEPGKWGCPDECQ